MSGFYGKSEQDFGSASCIGGGRLMVGHNGKRITTNIHEMVVESYVHEQELDLAAIRFEALMDDAKGGLIVRMRAFINQLESVSKTRVIPVVSETATATATVLSITPRTWHDHCRQAFHWWLVSRCWFGWAAWFTKRFPTRKHYSWNTDTATAIAEVREVPVTIENRMCPHLQVKHSGDNVHVMWLSREERFQYEAQALAASVYSLCTPILKEFSDYVRRGDVIDLIERWRTNGGYVPDNASSEARSQAGNASEANAAPLAPDTTLDMPLNIDVHEGFDPTERA